MIFRPHQTGRPCLDNWFLSHHHMRRPGRSRRAPPPRGTLRPGPGANMLVKRCPRTTQRVWRWSSPTHGSWVLLREEWIHACRLKGTSKREPEGRRRGAQTAGVRQRHRNMCKAGEEGARFHRGARPPVPPLCCTSARRVQRRLLGEREERGVKMGNGDMEETERGR